MLAMALTRRSPPPRGYVVSPYSRNRVLESLPSRHSPTYRVLACDGSADIVAAIDVPSDGPLWVRSKPFVPFY